MSYNIVNSGFALLKMDDDMTQCEYAIYLVAVLDNRAFRVNALHNSSTFAMMTTKEAKSFAILIADVTQTFASHFLQ
jgi:hypothetical protein